MTPKSGSGSPCHDTLPGTPSGRESRSESRPIDPLTGARTEPRPLVEVTDPFGVVDGQYGYEVTQ